MEAIPSCPLGRLRRCTSFRSLHSLCWRDSRRRHQRQARSGDACITTVRTCSRVLPSTIAPTAESGRRHILRNICGAKVQRSALKDTGSGRKEGRTFSALREDVYYRERPWLAYAIAPLSPKILLKNRRRLQSGYRTSFTERRK